MGLDIGGILGAAANLNSSFSKPKSLKSFLKNIDKFGIQVQNDFEVNFSGLQDATFFITSIDFPEMHIDMGDVYYYGRSLKIPVKVDYNHEFNITVLNDAKGYIYSSLHAFIASSLQQNLANSGYTMIIKALQGKKTTAVVTMRGVVLTSISGLSYGTDQNSISTFTIGGYCLDYSVSPGELNKVSGIAGAIGSLIK